ncbi:MAG: ABC transporter permease subunit [Oscillospiraceae bacterium]|nr:ABC transporter permease subunit [Oscillospiraceae bacterium]
MILLIIWVILWQIFYLSVNNDIIIANPYSVFCKIIDLIFISCTAWPKIFISTLRTLCGFFLAIVFSITIAFVTNLSKFIKYFLNPLIHIIKTTPIACFIILALIWVPSFWIPSFISFLIAFPILYSNILKGVASVEPNLIEMSKVFRFSRWNKMKMIYFPAIKPHFFSSCVSGIGLAWKSGISAEVISNSRNSIGMEIYFSQVHLNTINLFAWTIIIAFFSSILEKIVLKGIFRNYA